jgi:ribosome-associated protein
VAISTLSSVAASSSADVSSKTSERSLQLAVAAARTAADNQGRDIALLDLRDQTAIFDYFVLATGTSRRQLHAMSEEIDQKLERELNDRRLSLEGYRESRWILLDYGSVVIHLFDDETRRYYGLENLWGGAPKIDLAPYGLPADRLLAGG